ncbi:MAG: phosphoribosylamine--glycine ligase [bacterium]
MKVLVVGGGGREHALVWKLAKSPKVTKLYCAPGNAGIADAAECVDISAEDIGSLKEFALKRGVDLTVVGPEAPLVVGIADEFSESGLKVFGPSKRAALIEGSKSFAKRIMAKYGIPTGAYAEFTDPDEAKKYVEEQGAPIVVKADGLAAGKGVTVARTTEEALDAIHNAMVKKIFGEDNAKVVVEEHLDGEEASILAFTDGRAVAPMVPSQDHKRVYDGDLGPNTGGMGAYAPAPFVTPEVLDAITEEILKPTIAGMSKEGFEYRGVLYAGLMIKEGRPKVLEFNCRFGDPETQVVLPLLETDLLDPLLACIEGNLDGIELKWSDRAAVCVVLASGGYPLHYEKGKAISGLGDCESMEDVVVFHAGTALRDGRIVTSGGRVLGVTALGSDIRSAIRRAYEATNKIYFEGMHYRRDIGRRALQRVISRG